MNPLAWPIVLAWSAFFIYWIFSAHSSRAREQTEPLRSRLLHLGLVIMAFALVTVLDFSILSWHILHRTYASYAIGLILLALGLGVAVWARRHLSTYWSGTITIKSEHRLIRTGPYAWMRHPIYVGFIVGMVGTALALGELRGFLSVIILFIAYCRKIRIEEAWLVQRFGEEYERYQRAVRALLPFVL